MRVSAVQVRLSPLQIAVPLKKGGGLRFGGTEPVLGRVSTRGGIMLLNGVMQL